MGTADRILSDISPNQPPLNSTFRHEAYSTLWRETYESVDFILNPSDTTLCTGDTLLVPFPDIPDYLSVVWEGETQNDSLLIDEAGVFVVSVESIPECSSSDEIIVDYCLFEMLPADTSACASVTLAANVAGLFYQWSTGETAREITVTQSQNLTVTTTNFAGETITETVNVVIHNDALTFDIQQNNIDCADADNGSVALLSDNLDSFNFLWNNGETSSEIFDLSPDLYSVTVSDENDCTLVLEMNITEPTPVSVSEVFTPPTGNTENDGLIFITPEGGIAPYSILHLNPNMSGFNANNLPSGIYGYTIIDANGCTLNGEISFLISNNTSSESDISIQIFPNPFVNKFVIESKNTSIKKYRLLDASGRTIIDKTLPSASNSIKINAKDLPSGIYQLELTDEESIHLFRIVKI